MAEFEYANFGDKIVRRLFQTSDEWETCADNDIDARVAMGIKQAQKEERAKNGPPRIATVIIRAPRNIEIGEKLGLGWGEFAAEALAVELQNDKDTQTTRIDEEEFDRIGTELGHSPEDFRARFKGTYNGTK